MNVINLWLRHFFLHALAEALIKALVVGKVNEE